jgi:anaerobic selenocysteine-containing dehydrogenase
MKTQEFYTFCRVCLNRCSIKATAEDGKLVQIAADKKSGLGSTLCAKGLALPEILNHPDRLKYPQKRQGARGTGEWQRISWDEALDTIAEKLLKLKTRFGPESVAFGLGEPKGLELAFVQRIASAFRTPNVCTPGHICHIPTELASTFTSGSACAADEEYPPRLMVVWGCNPLDTHYGMQAKKFNSALQNGAKLLVIDPRKTDIASKAYLWLKPRPGSDSALAMGIMKVIIDERLYDEDFVTRWTVGFDQLKEHVKSYHLEDVERATWVPREQIERVARLYAKNKPATIQSGNALEHSINSFQTCRAVSILRAITGNLAIPGGEIFITPCPLTSPGRFMLLREFPRKAEKTIGSEFKLALRSGFIPRQSLVKAIWEEKPYPVKAGLFFATNPLITYPNAAKTYQALMKLDFMVVADLFMTPSAAIADIVLPAATTCEYDELAPYPAHGAILAYPKLVDPPGECWPDMKMVNELAKRLGLKEYFWDDEREALDLILQPSGLSFEEFKQKRFLKGKKEYRQYEKDGFRTPSGKVEIYSKRLEELDYSPLPFYQELSRFGFSEPTGEYPLLLTNAKERHFVHSAHKNIASLRRRKAEPVIELNPELAHKAGLKQGDWVYIETRRGKIKQKLQLSAELDPRVAIASSGWWFPEEPSNLHEWNRSNINMLTESEPPHEPTLGSVELRGVPCKVYKA